jgi:hypothetical protein
MREEERELFCFIACSFSCLPLRALQQNKNKNKNSENSREIKKQGSFLLVTLGHVMRTHKHVAV